eukprot:CFRG0443T1
MFDVIGARVCAGHSDMNVGTVNANLSFASASRMNECERPIGLLPKNKQPADTGKPTLNCERWDNRTVH